MMLVSLKVVECIELMLDSEAPYLMVRHDFQLPPVNLNILRLDRKDTVVSKELFLFEKSKIATYHSYSLAHCRCW